jgi:hypothetical protein
MMCWGTGRDRIEAEYARLLAGWRYYRTWYPKDRTLRCRRGSILDVTGAFTDYADTLRRKRMSSEGGRKITRHKTEVGIMQLFAAAGQVVPPGVCG